MTAIASSDLVISQVARSARKTSSRIVEEEVTISFGNSALTYPSGGIPMPTTLGAFGRALPVREIILLDGRNSTTGTHYYADVPNMVLRAWHQGYTPQIILEEVPTLTGTTTKSGTLAYPPAYIFAACQTVSAAIGAIKIIPTSATAAAGQVKMNWTTGAFTSYAETPSLMTFSYIPQQPSGPFSAANMVVDQAITAATGNVTATQRMAAISYLYQTTATAALLGIGHANASGVVAVDINSTGDTVVSFNSAQNAKSVAMTGLKYAGFQQPAVEWIDQATYTLGTEAYEFGFTAGDRKNGVMIPGFGNALIAFHDSSTYDRTYITGQTGTPAAGVVTYNLLTGVLTTAETGDAETLTDLPMMFLSNLYTSHHGLAELTTNHAPAATTLRALVRY